MKRVIPNAHTNIFFIYTIFDSRNCLKKKSEKVKRVNIPLFVTVFKPATYFGADETSG